MSEEFPQGTGPLPPVSEQDVVSLARAAIEASREESRRVDDGSTATELQPPGITVDLTHKNIVRLPDEVIDIIKDEIERLAISHNRIISFPARLAECKRLRYLNVRYNNLKEVPKPVLQLASLEILDLSRNKIRTLPEGIGNLTSLKVLAISRNRIERLPLCLGDLKRLQLLKFDDNPLIFPPPEVYAPDSDLAQRGNSNEEEAISTSKVMKYLRLRRNNHGGRSREHANDSNVDMSNDPAETPRPQPRGRGPSGRFPVKPSISNIDTYVPSTSPEWQPPMSHYEPMPPIPLRYENRAPQIPPRSQQRYGQSVLKSSLDGPAQKQPSLLSPPEGRAPGNSLGSYQTNASSENLSRAGGFRSASIITPRLANHPSTLEPSSLISPATAKMPMTSLLVGPKGNILGQFEQSDYANVDATREPNRREDLTRTATDRQRTYTKYILRAALGSRVAILEQSKRLQFLRSSFEGHALTHIVNDLDLALSRMIPAGERLSTVISEYINVPILSMAQIKEVEIAIANLTIESRHGASFALKYMHEINDLGPEIMRMMFFTIQHAANEVCIANTQFAKALDLHHLLPGEPQEASSLVPKALQTNRNRAQTRDAATKTSGNGASAKGATTASSSKPPPTASSFKFPTSPLPSLTTSGIPVMNQKFLTSPTDVQNMFATQDFVNAGPNAKEELLFLEICKSLHRMLSLCIEDHEDSVGPGLLVIRDYYENVVDRLTLDPNHGQQNRQSSLGFTRLATLTGECYDKLVSVGSAMSGIERRGQIGVVHSEFWIQTRDAITKWHSMVNELKLLKTSMDPKVKAQMKEIHNSIKALSTMIKNSPWSNYMNEDFVYPSLPHNKQSSIGSVPTTPLGAALGPAAAAAIPNAARQVPRFNVFERADRYLANPGPFRREKGKE